MNFPSRFSSEFFRIGSFLPLGFLALALTLGFLGLSAYVRDDLAASELLRVAPRANLARPREGPAIYAGTIVGPAGRVDPTGRSVAAHWWWAVKSEGDDGWKTVCFEREIRGLRLRDDSGKEMPIEAFDTDEPLSLVSDDRDDFRDPLFIDLASEPKVHANQLPAPAAKCVGEHLEFRARALPAGARVEVLACARDEALARCPGRPAAVIAVAGMERHRRRRLAHATLAVVVASSALFCLSLLVAIQAFRSRKSFEIAKATVT